MMEKLDLKELSLVDTEKVANALFHNMRDVLGYKISDEEDLKKEVAGRVDAEKNEKKYHIYSVLCAYILYKMQSTIIYESYEEFWKNSYKQIPKKISDVMIRYGDINWDLIKNLIGRFSSYELLAFILFDNGIFDSFLCEESTPRGVLKLCNYLLEIKDSDEVLELCSGKGNFLVEATLEGMKANYRGMENNSIVNDIAIIRATLLRENFEYLERDVLQIRGNDKKRADKIFSNYPFGVKILNDKKEQNSMVERFNIPVMKFSRASSDWVFNFVVVDHLNENGKAVVIMLNNSTWNEADKELRKYFITKGLIETVITLPANIFSKGMLPASIVVLSKNNEKITFVDAREHYKKGRRKNEITDQDVKTIIRDMKENSQNVTVKTIKEIEEKDYSLNVNLYSRKIPDIENGVRFESVIKKIERGIQSKAGDFDEYRTTEPTDYKVLQLAHINDGIISMGNDVEYLKPSRDKFEKYFIKNRALVISKTGIPAFKTAIVEKEDHEKWIASGNLFVVEIDEEKINPFYLQAFLMSDAGTAILNSVHTGVTIPSVSKANLMKMTIPLPSRDEQERVADEFMAALDETVKLRKQLEKSKSRMKRAFEEGKRYH